MNSSDLDILVLRTDRIATRLAASQRQRRDDLRQEAILGVLEAKARSGFDPARGTWSGFVAATAWGKASKLSWKLSSPASTASNGELQHLGKTAAVPVDSLKHARAENIDQEDDHAELSRLLRAVIARGRHADAVAEVLLHEKPVRAVAAARAKDEIDLKSAVAETRAAIAKDRRIREFVRAA